MKDNYFIGIAGIIAAGKTTLTKDLAKTLGYKAYLEPVQGNPYLNDFYKAMKRWGLLCNFIYCMQDMSSIKE